MAGRNHLHKNDDSSWIYLLFSVLELVGAYYWIRKPLNAGWLCALVLQYPLLPTFLPAVAHQVVHCNLLRTFTSDFRAHPNIGDGHLEPYLDRP